MPRPVPDNHIRAVSPNPPPRDTIVASHQRIVRPIAAAIWRKLPPCFELEDLQQAGWMALLEAVEDYDAGRGVPLELYLRMKVRGAILDSIRGKRYRDSTQASLEDEAAEPPDPQANPERQAQVSEVWDAIGELPPRQREIIELRYGGHGRSQREVARKLGISQPSVQECERRAVERLRLRMAA